MLKNESSSYQQSQTTLEAPANTIDSAKFKRRATFLGILATICLYLAGFLWLWASPTGSSPDDDYHLTSLWCPHPVEKSTCKVREINGKKEILAPRAVVQSSKCYAFEDTSAACISQIPKNQLTWTKRFDQGDYPRGFYQIEHIFVGKDFTHSALSMRWFNWTIGFALVASIAWLAPRRHRVAIISAPLLAWVPLGTFLIPSNNPSSWAISGAFAFAAGLTAATSSSGWRRRTLITLAICGALLCILSRADASFYVFVLSCAVWIFLGIKRDYRYLLGICVALSIWGLWVFRTSGQNEALASSGSLPLSPLKLFVLNVMELPNYILGFHGLWNRSLGWFDTPLPQSVHVSAIFTVILVLFITCQFMTWRKFITLGWVAAVICGVPTLIMVLQKMPFITYQPRYMFPLYATFLLFALLPSTEKKLVVRKSTSIFIVILLNISFIGSLLSVLIRFTRKSSGTFMQMANNPLWWWDNFPLSPVGLLLLSSVLFALSTTVLLLLFNSHNKKSSQPLALLTCENTPSRQTVVLTRTSEDSSAEKITPSQEKHELEVEK